MMEIVISLLYLLSTTKVVNDEVALSVIILFNIIDTVQR